MGTPFSKIGGNPIVLGLDGLKDEVKAGLNTPDEFPSLSAGSATGITGDVETASWMARQTNVDGAALIESVKGNTLRWNQLITNGDTERTGAVSGSYMDVRYSNATEGKVAGHKYLFMVHAYADAQYTASLVMADNVTETQFLNFTIGSSYEMYAAILTAGYSYSSVTFSLRIRTDTGVTGLHAKNAIAIDLTAMFGAGNEPATVAEFEALFPEPYYPYDAGSLLPVRMEGIETVGFNQWDEVWELGAIRESDGSMVGSTTQIRSKNFIPVFPSTTYCNSGNYTLAFFAYDANKEYVGFIGNVTSKNTFTTPAGCAYLLFFRTATTYQNDICINLSDPTRNGTYEPYWSAQRAIAASTYFPDGMRSAGSVRDELTSTEAIHRVGEVDLGTLDWNSISTPSDSIFRSGISGLTPSMKFPPVTQVLADAKLANYALMTYEAISGSDDMSFAISPAAAARLVIIDKRYTDAAAFKAAMSGVMLHYALATPTTTPIDPPIPLSYRTGAGGTERVMVAEGTMSAPPIFATRYPLDPADLAASIAPVDGPTATTNHQVGDLLMLGFTLCKATQVIVTGETIAIGTNVTRTTVAAELAALSE